MTMADIWLTAAARHELQALRSDEKQAVSETINAIGQRRGVRLDIPVARDAEPFLALEPPVRHAPVVIYRRTTPEERGDWLVVSLMDRHDYDAARRAEGMLAVAPPAVREIVHAAVAGTVSTFNVESSEGTPGGGSAPTTSR
jgi:hypothetical protein